MENKDKIEPITLIFDEQWFKPLLQTKLKIVGQPVFQDGYWCYEVEVVK